MSAFFGMIYESFDDCINFTNENSFAANSLAILPIDSIHSSLHHQVLLNTQTVSNQLCVILKPSDTVGLNLCNYLSINKIFLSINENTLYEDASATMNAIRTFPNTMFFALVSDFIVWWQLSEMCDHHANLGVSPPVPNDPDVLFRWSTNYIKSFIIKPENLTEDFSIKPELMPVILILLERGVPLITMHHIPDVEKIVEKLSYLISTTNQLTYVDVLQPPMQPLMTNLPSASYEIFEMDRTKYDLYQEAVQKALEAKGPESIVAIVGAGRGPIVDAAIRAGAKNLFVVEKNPSALELLHFRMKLDWKDNNIQLFEGDMRSITLPKKIDILVSELLGGFGDNELSPECLAGCEGLLAENAVSIPSSYDAILVPIMSDNLWTKAYNEKKMHLMSVVFLKSSLFLSEPQKCFSFTHPGPNEMYPVVRLQYRMLFDGDLHGFGGWFVCDLFDGVIMSTSPLNGTPGMFSWFPVYFPITKPLVVRVGDIVEVIFSRNSNGKVVWYEWTVAKPEAIPIQNSGGQFFSMGLQI